MKKLFLIAACTAIMTGNVSCSKSDADTKEFKAPKEMSDSISAYYGSVTGMQINHELNEMSTYQDMEIPKKDVLKGIQFAFANADNKAILIGMSIGSTLLLRDLQQMESQGIEIDRILFLKHFRKAFEADTFDYEQLGLDTQRINSIMSEVEQLRIQFEKEAADKASDSTETDGLDEGSQYIEKMKAIDSEIITSASGLSYKIIDAGSDPRITDESNVSLFYKGSLIDGTVFDQTEGTPVEFRPTDVIPGFREGLKLLGKGGKAILYIPSNLAYGPRGAGGLIGPNATLIFEIEITDVR